MRTVVVDTSAVVAILGNESAADGLIEALDAVIGEETDGRVKTAFMQARAAAVLQSDLPEDQKLEAVSVLRDRGGRARAGAGLQHALGAGSDFRGAHRTHRGARGP